MAGVLATLACERAPRTVIIPLPNTYSPEKEGKIEVTKFGEKIVISNYQDLAFTKCVVTIGGTIRGELGEMPARSTVTLMRSRFHPYTDVDAFYARAKTDTVLECDSDRGRVTGRFVDGPEYTVPAAALKPRP